MQYTLGNNLCVLWLNIVHCLPFWENVRNNFFYRRKKIIMKNEQKTKYRVDGASERDCYYKSVKIDWNVLADFTTSFL